MKKIQSNFQYVAVIALLLAMFAGGLKHDVVFGELSGNAVGGNLVLNISEAAAVDVEIHGLLRGEYGVPTFGRMVHTDWGLNDGPVRVMSLNGFSIIPSERAYRNAANLTDFNEMMGMPRSLIETETEYWFPFYDGTDFMKTYLVIGNASTDDVTKPSAIVDVYLNGELRGHYTIEYGKRAVYTDWGKNDGPVRVVSTNGVPIIPSERAYRGPNLTDFNEMMGMPRSLIETETEYWFPFYDGTDFMKTYLVIGNASTDDVTKPSAIVDVYLNGELRGHYTIEYGKRAVYTDWGKNDGPVRVVSTNGVPIIPSERAYRNAANLTDFNEMMGLPSSLLTTEYWFPFYSGTDFMKTYLVIGNASTDDVTKPSAIVDVYLNGELRGHYTIEYGKRAVYTDWGKNDGPVRVVSTNGVPIIPSERAYRNAANLTDFNELMGMPLSLLETETEYWFPFYDGTSFMKTYLVVANLGK